MINYNYAIQKIIDCDRLCDICRYRHKGCDGGVRGGPSGPIYPPCADWDISDLIEEDLVEELYQELIEEEIIMIEKVLFNNPATIVWWEDGTKTVVKADSETFDPEKGLAMAIAKKYLGNKGNYWNEFKKWIKENTDE